MAETRLKELLATSTPDLSECSEDGNGAPRLDSAIYLKKWLLDLQLKVKAADVERHRMLKSAIHALVTTAFGEQIECLVDEAAGQIYEKLTRGEGGDERAPV